MVTFGSVATFLPFQPQSESQEIVFQKEREWYITGREVYL